MPEIIWKQGAENDLFHIFADLEERSEGSGERFVQKVDFTLGSLRIHPKIAPLFENPMRRLVIGSTATVYSIRSKLAASLFTR